MIRSFKIKDPQCTPIPWWASVHALRKPREFEFKPGLNILWGRNGSGKSTVIKALARLTHCEQSGNPVVTRESLRTLSDVEGLQNGVGLEHDGAGVRYFDPSHEVGLVGGQAAFDDDFMFEGISNIMFKGSSGETTLNRIQGILNNVVGGIVPEVDWRVEKGYFDLETERLLLARHFLKGSGKRGLPTVLLDEPARSLDLIAQPRIWNFIRAYSPQVQFIIASHNPYALNIPGANYIELTEGYLERSIESLQMLESWSGRQCMPLNTTRGRKRPHEKIG